MFKIITALLIMTSVAVADYNLIVPQKPSGGTSVWAQIVVQEWEKHLGEKINLVYKPGARDQLGPNEFQNKLRFDNKTILVSHGGNGISYLVEPVDYNYLDWENIGQMNLNIIVGARKTADTLQWTNPVLSRIRYDARDYGNYYAVGWTRSRL
jgi:hypothetical protein